MPGESVAMSFDALQRDRLLDGWRADLPGSNTPHVLIALPSYSLDRNVYEHYGDRLPPLENRYLYGLLRAREPTTRVIYLSSLPVHPEILEGYLDLVDPALRASVLERGRVVTPDDLSRRPLAEKLMDRGDLIDMIRLFIGDEPSLIEAWNVTEAEAALAVALGAPIHGTHPRHRQVASKSNGRRLMREAGVPVPQGIEDVRSSHDVVRAIVAMQAERPAVQAVVIKLDDSVAGDGNVVVALSELPHGSDGVVSGTRAAEAVIDARLPDWYKAALVDGGVVEERIAGDDFRSPSAQATITPAGDVTVLATHEQRLGGPDGQVYEGCSFPADPAYAPLLGAYAERVGRRLAEVGAVGRFAVDFVTCRDPSGAWQVHGLEINLRKGGTTHPFGVCRFLRGGAYQTESGGFVSARGKTTHYGATDNLIDDAWIGRSPHDVRTAIAAAGLGFDRATETGIVPHLLDCLLVDGRMGYTAIADDPAAVADLEQRLFETLRTS
ncbi:MAG: hypothetical protein QOI95_1804 [Acidimicrobiaceae bacterium]|jgi:hypothetical protein